MQNFVKIRPLSLLLGNSAASNVHDRCFKSKHGWLVINVMIVVYVDRTTSTRITAYGLSASSTGALVFHALSPLFSELNLHIVIAFIKHTNCHDCMYRCFILVKQLTKFSYHLNKRLKLCYSQHLLLSFYFLLIFAALFSLFI